jgi:hypothetical protein
MLLSMEERAKRRDYREGYQNSQTSETRHVTLLLQSWQLIEFICG